MDSALIAIGRVIGKPRGWERVVRTLAPPGRLRGRPYFMRMPEGYEFPVDPGTLIGWSVHFFGTYEPEVRRHIQTALGPGAAAFDVGANVGWHTLLMAALVGASGRVYAFEPNASTCARLNEAVRRNGFGQVRVDHRALSDRAGTAAFSAPAAGDLWDGTGRLVDGTSPDAQIVSCTTIDGVAREEGLRRLDLIKVDVEGWELPVLRGAREVLEGLRPNVIFEYDPAYVARSGSSGDAVVALLTAARYRIYALPPRGSMVLVEQLDARATNFLALPRERAL